MSRTPDSPPAPNAKRPRKRRKWPWILAALFLVFLLGLLLLPTLASASFTRGLILAFAGDALGADVEADAISLGWGGRQRIEGLRIRPRGRDPEEAPLLELGSARIDGGLWTLATSSETPVEVTLERLLVAVTRDPDGHFNFSGLLEAGKTPKAPKREKAERKEPAAEPPAKPLPETISLPSLPRGVRLRLSGGEIRYQDQHLGTEATLTELECDVNATGPTAQLKAAGKIQSAKGRPAELAAALTITGLGRTTPVAKLEVNGNAGVSNLDLEPYQGLITELLGTSFPPGNVQAQLSAKTEDGVLRFDSKVRSELVRVEQLSIEVPLVENGDSRFTLTVSDAVLQLAPALKTFEPWLELPEGTSLEGNVTAQLIASANLSIQSLTGGLDSLPPGLRVDIGVLGKNLRAEIPSASDAESAPASPSSEQASPEGPGNSSGGAAGVDFDEVASVATPAILQFQDDEVALDAVISTNADGSRLELERCQISGAGATAAATGSLEQLRLALQGSLEVHVEELKAALPGRIPDAVEMSPQTKVKLTNLVVTSDLSGSEPLLVQTTASALLAVDGPVAQQGFRVESATAALALTGGRAAIVDLEASVNGGQARSSELWIDLGKDPSPYGGSIQVEDVGATYEMTELFAYVIPFVSLDEENAEFSGKVAADLQLSGAGFETTDLARSLVGTGKLRVRDGKLGASRFFTQAIALLGGKAESLHFVELGSDFEVGAARITAQNVFLKPRTEGKLRDLGLSGVTGFDGALDFSVNLATLQATVGDKKLQKILGQAQKVLGGDTFPLKLGGTIEAPKLQLAFAGGSEDGQGNGKSDLESLLEKGLDQLLGGGKSEKGEPVPESTGKGKSPESPEAKPAKALPVEQLFDLFKKKKKKKKRKKPKDE